jgi:hypothetical protein
MAGSRCVRGLEGNRLEREVSFTMCRREKYLVLPYFSHKSEEWGVGKWFHRNATHEMEMQLPRHALWAVMAIKSSAIVGLTRPLGMSCTSAGGRRSLWGEMRAGALLPTCQRVQRHTTRASVHPSIGTSAFFLNNMYRGVCFELARGSVVIEALCHKPEGRGFKSQWGELIFFQFI